jgi:peptidoglycan hydrolase CwlO-like protein
MLKKTIVAGVAGLLLLGLLFGRSHVLTTIGMVKQSVKDNVPIDFEIKRARQMVKDLQPEIEKNMHLIAREETTVAKLEREVKAAEEQLASDRGDILRLKDDLDSGSEVFVYAGKSYSAKQVKADLADRFDEFTTREATTTVLKKRLAARQASLEAAQEKLEAMLSAKRQLEVDVENLEARLKMVEVAQTSSEFKFDDSRLSRVQDLVEEISDRIEVAERLVNADVNAEGRIPLDEPEAQRDITEEVADYFGEGRPEVENLVNSSR